MEFHVYYFCTVLSLSLFVTFSVELKCDNLNCRNNECGEDGKCLHECMDGYITDDKGQCVEGCSENCSKCDNGVCTDCKSGSFGHQCLRTCEWCKDGSCEKENGQCLEGCEHGFHNMPWCNISDHDHHHHRHNHHKAKISKLDEEEKSRSVFIWIAGGIIMAVLCAIAAMIVLIVYNRENNNSEQPESERLNEDKRETTELE